MGRKKESFIWDHFGQTNGDSKCKYCETAFKGKSSVTRLKKHLLGIEGGGIRICARVPDHVKKALADAPSSSKRPRIEPSASNDKVNNPVSISAAQHNNESENREHIGGRTQELLQVTEQELLEGSRNHAHDRVVEGFHAVLENTPQVELDSGINEVNHLTSTSAAQQNSGLENQVQVGERMPAVIQSTDQHFFEGVDEMIEAMMAPETNGEPFPTIHLEGQAFSLNIDAILEWLKSGEVASIGIHGMGGVGKTMLVTHIYNRILNDWSTFGDAYWITVSQGFSIQKLQTQIAKAIRLDFGDEDDLKKRAAKLLKTLSVKCKFILILDDLWNHFDMKKIGVPIELKGCKLIVTTRSLDVCRRMNVQKKIKVEPLSQIEAWKLFVETLGHDLRSEVEPIARCIARECDGLPLGIITMAGSLREVEDIHVWKNALTDLQNSEVRQDDMEPEVFRILRLSYARLNDPALQQCLLYCALYPEDFSILREELIEYLVVEGIIKQKNTRQATFDKGHDMLHKLENANLLERKGDSCVAMHDLVRDMAIQIMEKCSPSLIAAGKQLTCLPQGKCWTEYIVRASLMKNHIAEIPDNHLPSCSNLSTLLLCRNEELKWIAETFFNQLQGLKVLNLSETAIEKLPVSVANLENLTALFLRSCQHLREVPPLTKLGAMEILDLFECTKIEKVPEGLESLSNLKYLNLLWTGVKHLPAGFLKKLSHLQFLAFQNLSETPEVKVEEIAGLRKLETLVWIFHDHGEFNKYFHLLPLTHMESELLSEYFLLVGRYDERDLESRFDGTRFSRHGVLKYRKREVEFKSCNLSREMILPENIERVTLSGVSIEDGRGVCLKNASDLKAVAIEYCKEIEYLLCSSSSPSIFQTIETVCIRDMENLHALLAIPLPPHGVFSHLKDFTMVSCPMMKHLFLPGLLQNLLSLEIIDICHCSEMEEVIAAEEHEEGNDINNHSIFTHSQFTLPKLRHFNLGWLPKLKSICRAKIMCPSLQEIVIIHCPELQNIPISLPLPSLTRMDVYPKEWWKWVEWGSTNDGIELQKLHDYYSW